MTDEVCVIPQSDLLVFLPLGIQSVEVVSTIPDKT